MKILLLSTLIFCFSFKARGETITDGLITQSPSTKGNEKVNFKKPDFFEKNVEPKIRKIKLGPEYFRDIVIHDSAHNIGAYVEYKIADCAGIFNSLGCIYYDLWAKKGYFISVYYKIIILWYPF